MLHVAPRSLSDEDLIRASASTPMEEVLAAGGCLGGILVFPLLFVGQLLFGSAALPFALGLALIVVALALAYRAISRPKQPFREELRYRCGQAQFSRYVEEAEAELRRDDADWIVLLTAAHLPHGDFRWLRFVVRAGPSAQYDLRVWDRKQEVLRRAEAAVPDMVTQEILRLLTAWDLPALSDAPVTVVDGTPCQLAILRREPWAAVVAHCNLGGFYFGQPEHPTMRACFALYDLAWSRLWSDAADG
jgi:hypothetical protein